VKCSYSFICTSSCPSTFEGVEPSPSYSGHGRGNSSPALWTAEVPSQLGSGKSRTWSRFSSVNEVPVLDIRCPTYSTSFRLSLVFAGLAVTFFSRSFPSTLRVEPCINTSSVYIARQYFIRHTTLKGPEPLSPYWVMKVVYSCESGCRGVWWYPVVKSIMPKTLGFRVPILLIICWMLGMDHPSSPPVAEFNWTKSRVKLHFWGWPSGVGLGTRWTWLHSVARESLMTSRSKSTSTCFRISFCYSSECLRGGARLHGSRHLSSSITIFIGPTAAGSLRTFVANTSMNSRTNDFSLAWSCGDPSKVIWDIN
jgi:hypothetical protein